MPGTVTVLPDLETLSRSAADAFVAAARAALAERGRFSVSLSGGSTPRKLYQLLATEPYRDSIDWQRVHLFWGDERYVPYDDPLSNVRMVREALSDHVPIPPANLHPMPTGPADLEEAAHTYTRELHTFFGEDLRFDLALMGMGADGHTASLFPGDTALQVRDRPVAVARPVSQPTARLTLTVPVFNRARTVLFLVAGADKADVLAEVLAGGHTYPSQWIVPDDGQLLWYIDRAAAARL
jgi:6-phosphogluconolactonase